MWQADGDKGRLSLEDAPEPSPEDGEVLAESLALGICATDRSLIRRPPIRPERRDWLVLGHESLGRVLEAPPGSGFVPGDLLVGIVRRPDPVPCPACEAGYPDLCQNGRYSERGIVGRDGFGSERFRIEATNAVRVERSLGVLGVLMEPTSIVAKGWERVDGLVERRERALVLGAGPIGMLAALLGVQRGYRVEVMDQVADGAKPRQVRALDARYHAGTGSLPGGYDVVFDCTGALLGEAVRQCAPGGVTCLVSGGTDRSVPPIELAELGRELVGRTKAVIGTVNANRRHFEAAHLALCQADPAWLAGLLGPSVPAEEWARAFEVGPDVIKAVIRFAE